MFAPKPSALARRRTPDALIERGLYSVMTHLLIATPDTHPAERDYSLGVILGEFLGLPWRRVRSPDAAIRLRLCDAPGEIRLPDDFFSHPEHDWRTPATPPQLPLPIWDSRALAADITLTDPRVPLITHGASPRPIPPAPTATPSEPRIDLPIDVFGAAFFMLSRYEEAVLLRISYSKVLIRQFALR